MKELDWIKENWIIVLTFFLFLALSSLTTTFSLYNLNILNHISIQDTFIIFFNSFLSLEFISLILFFSVVLRTFQKIIDRDSEYPGLFNVIVLALTILFFVGVLYFGKSLDLIILKKLFGKFALIYFCILFFFLSIRIMSIRPKLKLNKIQFKYSSLITIILFLHLLVIVFNLVKIEKSKLENVIIGLGNSQITTSQNLFILFQSSSYLILRDEKTKSNRIISMGEVKSITEFDLDKTEPSKPKNNIPATKTIKK